MNYAQALDQLQIIREDNVINYYKHQHALAQALDSEHFPHIVVVKKHRDAGFTTVALHLMLWQALSYENQRCVYFTHSQWGVATAKATLQADIRQSMNPLNCPTRWLGNSLIIEGTGSTIDICGFHGGAGHHDIDFSVIDEPAVGDNSTMLDLWRRLLVSIAVKGVCLIGSTPNGTHSKQCQDNWFYQTWVADNSFDKICWGVDDTEIAALLPHKVQQAKRTMSEYVYAQEWQAKFLCQPKNKDCIVGDKTDDYVLIEPDNCIEVRLTAEQMKDTRNRKMRAVWTVDKSPDETMLPSFETWSFLTTLLET